MRFIIRRIFFYAITLWAAISLNFLLPRMLPGDPLNIMLDKLSMQGEVTPAMRESLERLFGGTDAPLINQYFEYWGGLFRGDMGTSLLRYPTPVSTLIFSALPWTLVLVGTATVLSFLIGVGLGAWIGWKRGSWRDNAIPFTMLLQAVPYFWIALVLVYYFAVKLRWLPLMYGYDVTRFDRPEWSWAFAGSAVEHAILPVVTIVLSSFGGWLLGMRNMMVSTMSEDYMVTAEAKGLKQWRIFMWYGVRNASLPSLAGFAISLGFVVAGSLVMEQVFSYPGVGKLMIDAVNQNDYALMQGIFLIVTLTVLAANFLMDFVYGVLDPRTRQHG